MRRVAMLLLGLGFASPSLAQHKGAVVLDAMTTPGRHFGLGYYVSDRISLRPSLGLSYAAQNGMFVDVGTDLRFELQPDNAWTLYGTTSAYYRNGRSQLSSRAGSQTARADQQGVHYGAGAGLLRRVNDRLALFLDGRYVRSGQASTGTQTSFGQFRLDPQSQLVASLGLSFSLR